MAKARRHSEEGWAGFSAGGGGPKNSECLTRDGRRSQHPPRILAVLARSIGSREPA
jgi:hypothetical protein